MNRKENENENEKDNYIVLFKGAKLSKREANKAGVGIISGIIGILLYTFMLGTIRNKIICFIIIFVFVFFGYFWIGNKIFKK